jgi:hypothetical protein
MARCRNGVPRKRICICLDAEVFEVLLLLKDKTGLSMSSMAEGLMLIGLKSKLRGEAS